MDGMKTIVTNVWTNIKSVIYTGINWVIEKINWFIDKANAISEKVPGVPSINRIDPLTLQK